MLCYFYLKLIKVKGTKRSIHLRISIAKRKPRLIDRLTFRTLRVKDGENTRGAVRDTREDTLENTTSIMVPASITPVILLSSRNSILR